MALAEMCCDVIMTENDFKINHGIHIHGPSMSSLYAPRDNDPVLLRTTGYNHKIYHSRMQVFTKRGRGPCKSQPEFVQNGFKLLSRKMSSFLFFLINQKIKLVKNQPFCNYFWQNWCINPILDDVL